MRTWIIAITAGFALVIGASHASDAWAQDEKTGWEVISSVSGETARLVVIDDDGQWYALSFEHEGEASDIAASLANAFIGEWHVRPFVEDASASEPAKYDLEQFVDDGDNLDMPRDPCLKVVEALEVYKAAVDPFQKESNRLGTQRIYENLDRASYEAAREALWAEHKRVKAIEHPRYVQAVRDAYDGPRSENQKVMDRLIGQWEMQCARQYGYVK